MTLRRITTFCLIGAGALALGIAALPVRADLTGNYYTVAHGQNPDFENGIDGTTVTGLVESTLGADGLPVASAKGLSGAGVASGPITDVNASNEILWWTPGQDGVAFEKTQTDATPISHPSNFFPDGQSTNSNFYRTVHWTGTFDGSQNGGSLTVSLKADDDAFLFLDNQLLLDNGGVKAFDSSLVTSTVTGLTPGLHTVDLFFADRHEVQSAIEFDANVTLNAIPEVPGAAMLIFVGMGGAGLLRLRRAKKA
jgi:fibro-slime domain-containing protein